MDDLRRGVDDARACGRCHGTIEARTPAVGSVPGRIGRVLLVAVMTFLVLQVGWAGYRAIPIQVSYAYPTYIFDATDRRLVAGYADRVVVAVATDPGETVRGSDPIRSRYGFRVAADLKGSGGHQDILVSQSAVDVSGKFVTLIDGVEPIRAGQRYVLALVQDDQGELSLVSGPHSPERVAGGPGVVDRWRDAVRDQQWPPGVPRR